MSNLVKAGVVIGCSVWTGMWGAYISNRRGELKPALGISTPTVPIPMPRFLWATPLPYESGVVTMNHLQFAITNGDTQRLQALWIHPDNAGKRAQEAVEDRQKAKNQLMSYAATAHAKAPFTRFRMVMGIGNLKC